MSFTQEEYETTLGLLQDEYRTLVAERAAIVGTNSLNTPDIQYEDGGTTISKEKYLRLLSDRIDRARKGIKDHIALKDTIDAGSQAPWTIESDLNLD